MIEKQETKPNEQEMHIFYTSVLKRADKQKDRVEINPEQLTIAAIEAEV
jgi:hypothetical protein